MEVSESLESTWRTVPLFDFDLMWSVRWPSTEELRLLIEEVCESDKYIAKMSSVADMIARHLKQQFMCECEPEKECIVREDGITVGRLAIAVSNAKDDFLIDPVYDYIEEFFKALDEVPVYDDKSRYKKEHKLVSKVHNVFQQLASGHDYINIKLKRPEHKLIEVTARPKVKKVQELKNQFSGHVWCVDEHTNTCGVQLGKPGGKGKSIRLNYDPAERYNLLKYQLLGTVVQLEIEPYEHRGQRDGRLLSAEPVQGSLLDQAGINMIRRPR